MEPGGFVTFIIMDKCCLFFSLGRKWRKITC